MASSSGLGDGRFALRFVLARQLVSALAATVALGGPSFGATPESTKSDVERLVAAAAQAEAARRRIEAKLEAQEKRIRMTLKSICTGC